MMQVDDHVIIRLISKVVKGISRVLQKLLKYFNGTAILTSFVLPAAGFFSVIFTLNLNNALLPGKSGLFYCYLKMGQFYNISIKFLISLSNYHYIRLNCTLASQHHKDLLH